MNAPDSASGPEGRMTCWLVQTHAGQLAGHVPEEYASEKRAEMRATELAKLGKGPATFYAVDVEIETEGAA